MVMASAVTLGPEAEAAAARHHIPERHVRLARVCSSATWETPQFLTVMATLPDGRRVRMSCELERPEHVAFLRLA